MVVTATVDVKNPDRIGMPAPFILDRSQPESALHSFVTKVFPAPAGKTDDVESASLRNQNN